MPLARSSSGRPIRGKDSHGILLDQILERSLSDRRNALLCNITTPKKPPLSILSNTPLRKTPKKIPLPICLNQPVLHRSDEGSTTAAGRQISGLGMRNLFDRQIVRPDIRGRQRHGGRISKRLLRMLGPRLWFCSLERGIQTKDLFSNPKITVLYFCAMWSEQSIAFTEVLKQVHKNFKLKSEGASSLKEDEEDDLDIAIIVVSVDENMSKLVENMKKHLDPEWYSIPYRRYERVELSESSTKPGIPCLTVLASDGEVLTQHGRADVYMFEERCFVKWRQLQKEYIYRILSNTTSRPLRQSNVTP